MGKNLLKSNPEGEELLGLWKQTTEPVQGWRSTCISESKEKQIKTIV